MSKYFFCSVLVLFFCCKKVEQKSEEEVEIVEEVVDPDVSFQNFIDHYERFFKTNFQISECPGAALVIIKDSTVVLKKGYGVKAVNTIDSVDVNTVFRIASLSKGVTSVLAGNLVDHNELKWNQLIKASINRFSLRDREQAERIEVNHLLSHTTGLYKYTHTKLIHKGLPLDRIIPQFRYKGVIAKEGVDYEYQNAIFSIIEKVMEKETNVPFDQLIQERLFIPARMYNASSTYNAIKSNDNVALPHSFNPYAKRYNITSIHKNYYNVAAAGGVNASITDMSEYLKILLGYRPDIISPQALATVFNPFICTNNEDINVNYWEGVVDSFYAKGYRILDYRGRTLIYHSGNVNQYKAELMVDPENKIAICALFNAPNLLSPVTVPTFLNYYDFYINMNKTGSEKQKF